MKNDSLFFIPVFFLILFVVVVIPLESFSQESVIPALTIDNQGHVGINMYNATSTLQVNGTFSVINGIVGIGTTTPQGILQIGNDIDGLLFRNDGLGIDIQSLGEKLWINNAGEDVIITGYSGGGHVGIGIDYPERSLHVRGDVIRLDRDSSTPELLLTRWNSGFVTLLKTFAIGVTATNENNGTFYIADRGTTLGGVGAEKRLVIDNTGNVGIRTSTPASDLHIKQSGESLSSSAGLTLERSDTTDKWKIYTHSDDTLNFVFNNNYKGYITSNDGVYHVYSDYNLKKNIVPLRSVLDNVLELKPSSYHFKQSSNNSSKSIGFIAQDVEKIFPDLVRETIINSTTIYKSLAYDDFGVLAIVAIQEQQKIIEEQRNIIQELKNAICSENLELNICN